MREERTEKEDAEEKKKNLLLIFHKINTKVRPLIAWDTTFVAC